MSSSTRALHTRRSGVILVIVLGVTMVAAWLAIEILASIRKELARSSAPQSETRLRQTAYQLLEVSIGVLAEVKRFEEELYSPTQGWGFPLSYAGMQDSRELSTAVKRDPSDAGESGDTSDLSQALESTSELPNVAELPEQSLNEGTPPTDLGEELLADLLADQETKSRRQDGFAREINQVILSSETPDRDTDRVTLTLPKGLQARVRLYDESGKLSLRATSEARWLLFFQKMNFEENESKTLTDSLLDWMDADDEERENGAEKLTYAQLDPPYFAPNRPLRDFEELRYIHAFKTSFFDPQGLPNENYQIFKDNVSLYHDDEVNINSASDLVIQTLAEEKEFEADNVLDFLAGADLIFGTQDDRIFRPGLDPTNLPKDDNGEPIQLYRPIRYIRVEISVSNGQSIFYLNSILDVSEPHPGGVYPFKIIRIIENQPIP